MSLNLITLFLSVQIDCVSLCSLHPISFADVRPSIEDDLSIRDIATAYRFTPTEVGEYYIRVDQNADRTRRRFQKARKLLDEMSDVE